MGVNKIKQFIDSVDWIFAKTYAKTAPHEYIVREKLGMEQRELFDAFALYIKENGYTKYFYKKPFTYCNIVDKKYWHMENIINRDDRDAEYK